MSHTAKTERAERPRRRGSRVYRTACGGGIFHLLAWEFSACYNAHPETATELGPNFVHQSCPKASHAIHSYRAEGKPHVNSLVAEHSGPGVPEPSLCHLLVTVGK